MTRRGAQRFPRRRRTWMLVLAVSLGACDASGGSQASSLIVDGADSGATSIPAESSAHSFTSVAPGTAPPTDSGIAIERDLQITQPSEEPSRLPPDEADSTVSDQVEMSESPTGNSSDNGQSVTPTDDDAAVLPQVTFPEASVRDPEVEAADLERRRSVIGLFERLRVEAEHRRGYSRDAVFDGWLYSGGLSTRDRVLRDEQRADSTWFSAYDARVVTDKADLDIDHLVPLAEAWESGGHLWTEATWTRFANDLDDPRSLIAVSASTNRSKGARDPAEWWPPNSSYRCQYAVDWIAVKTRWNLSVDSAEHAVLETRIDQCASDQFEFDAPQLATDLSE